VQRASEGIIVFFGKGLAADERIREAE